jgi:hypothetical protein
LIARRMDLSLAKLDHQFTRKPLLVGGKAMEFHGLRPAGADIDLIADERDVADLARRFPDGVKNLHGDLGVCAFELEVWQMIVLFGYDDLVDGAIDAGDFQVISLEKPLVLKALATMQDKYRRDVELIAARIVERQYEQSSSELRGCSGSTDRDRVARHNCPAGRPLREWPPLIVMPRG